MGVIGKLNPFREEKEEKDDNIGGQHQEDAAPPPASAAAPQSDSVTADGPECSVCGQPGADKKFAGQYFHKKCLRKARKMAKGML